MRVLSAMQPSGQMHLGNYFGSMKPNLAFQGQADVSFYFIVDLHALTSIQDPEKLRKDSEDAILDYLACGFDPDKSILFRQSDVPEHTELMWILSTVTPMGLLERAVSYKEKVARGIKSSAGLFTYPVLMAADILLYHADTVPVGKDQQQHVEIARDIAGKFNNTYGETLTLPDPLIHEEVAVVPGVDGKKMSKSYGNTIALFGEEKATKKVISSIVTDSKGEHDPKDPDTCAVYLIHKLFLDEAGAKALADEYREGISYGDAKKKLFTAYMDYFSVQRAKRATLGSKDAKEVLLAGQKEASSVAQKTMDSVRKAVGLR